MLVDTVDKGLKAYKEARTELDANASLHPEVDTPRCTHTSAATDAQCV